jgi:LCP family protein required for cell wall assembly
VDEWSRPRSGRLFDSEPPSAPHSAPTGWWRSKAALTTAKVVAISLSVVVFAATGYSWARVEIANSGLTRADVIDSNNKTDNSGPQNILLVGIDLRTDAQGNPLPQNILDQLHAGGSDDGGDTTDTMIVIHIPAGGGKAVAFSIPRDSYVDLSGGYGKHKINSAYSRAVASTRSTLSAQGVSGAQLAVQSNAAGAKNSIDTVEQFTGLQINHFASVNLAGFYQISEAIGGVQVCLLHNTQDANSGANFTAGVHTIEGAEALEFVRQRDNLPNGDLDRIKRQQVFMASMAKQVLSGGVLTDQTKLSNLIGAIQKSVTLDSGWDILGFAQQLQGISGGNIQFLTIPIVNITLRTPSDGDAVQVDPAQVQAFIQQNIGGGTTPSTGGSSTGSPGSSGSSPSGSGNSANASVTVDVANGTTVTGLAARVLQALSGKGYTAGTATTTSARKTTIIEYASGAEPAAQQIAGALGGSITYEPDSALSSGHVKVLIGKDYQGPGAAPAANVVSGGISQHTEPAATSGGSGGSSGSGGAPITANGVPCIN